VESIIPFLGPNNLIIIESTIPPLTCRDRITLMIENATDLIVGKTVHLAHCPEHILPSNIFEEIVNNDRIVGAINREAREMAVKMYATFVKGKLLTTDDVTAELV
jgi:UDP-N-acetyl-D-mannosaminuronic acid dehydrogenase